MLSSELRALRFDVAGPGVAEAHVGKAGAACRLRRKSRRMGGIPSRPRWALRSEHGSTHARQARLALWRSY